MLLPDRDQLCVSMAFTTRDQSVNDPHKYTNCGNLQLLTRMLHTRDSAAAPIKCTGWGSRSQVKAHRPQPAEG